MGVVESIRRDLSHAIRVLRRRPGPAGAAVLVLALGSGICLPLLSLVDAGIAYSRSGTQTVGMVPAVDRNRLGLWSADAKTIAAGQMEHLETLLWTLAVAAVLVLAIVSINLLILLLSRGSARREEMALRGALGAGRARLASQLLLEGALLAGTGGVVGWVIARIGLETFRASWPAGMHLWIPEHPGVGVTTIALGLPAAVVLLAGLIPAWGASRKNLYRALPGGRTSAGRGERALRNAMVMMAVAASMTLLVGAGVLVRSFAPEQRAASSPITSEGTLVVNLDLTSAASSATQRAAMVDSVLQQVRAIPGVAAESIATPGTLLGLGPSDEVRAICDFCSRSVGPLFIIDGITRHHAVGPGFFESLGVPLIEGREFTAADRAGAAPVAIVSRTFGFWLFPRGDPMGKQIRVGGPDGDWVTVVGIAPDVRSRGIGTGAQPISSIYLSALQFPPANALLTVRTSGAPLEYEDAITVAIKSVSAAIPISLPTTLEQRQGFFESPLRWLAGVFATLAASAVLLAVLGLHGVIAFQVRQRTREVGIRMALGARPRSVVRLIMGESLRLTITGAYLGLMGAFTLARLLQLLILGVEPLDPITYGTVALLLGGVAFVASLRPARAAAGVDPLVALRYE